MISIFAGAIVSFAFGSLWYTVLFGRMWSRLMNFGPEVQVGVTPRAMAPKMLMMFILNLLTATVVYFLLPMLMPVTYCEFLLASLVIWVGFTFPKLLNVYLWENKSIQLVLIDTVYSIVNIALLTAVIFYF